MTWEEAVARYKQAFKLTDAQWPASRVGYYRSLWLYVKLLPHPNRVLEIGTMMGDSAFFLACALAGTDAELVCVDPILETGQYEYAEWDGHIPKPSVNPEEVRQRILASGIEDEKLRFIPKRSEDAFAEWNDQQHIDLLLVDGCHSFDAVCLDSRWMQHIEHGGYAVYDDWSYHVAAAVYLYINCRQLGWRMLHCSTDVQLGEWCVTILRRVG